MTAHIMAVGLDASSVAEQRCMTAPIMAVGLDASMVAEVGA